MNDLVRSEDGQLLVSSLDVANRFEKPHRVVLKSIRDLDCGEEFLLHNFMPRIRRVKGREYPVYDLTRDGFSFLCMGFTGKQASHWKVQYIKAFNMMERELLKDKDRLEWKQARLQGKSVRKDITNTIKDFVDYATGQGSKSASMYYSNITKMEYKALGILASNEKVESNFRDTLDLFDLGFLIVAEQVAKQSIQQGMERGSFYKDIYIYAKERVMNYADAVKMPVLANKKEQDNENNNI